MSEAATFEAAWCLQYDTRIFNLQFEYDQPRAPTFMLPSKPTGIFCNPDVHTSSFMLPHWRTSMVSTDF